MHAARPLLARGRLPPAGLAPAIGGAAGVRPQGQAGAAVVEGVERAEEAEGRVGEGRPAEGAPAGAGGRSPTSANTGKQTAWATARPAMCRNARSTRPPPAVTSGPGRAGSASLGGGRSV